MKKNHLETKLIKVILTKGTMSQKYNLTMKIMNLKSSMIPNSLKRYNKHTNLLILQECTKLLKSEYTLDDEDGGSSKLWNFRELLSWKVPEHLSSEYSKQKSKL